MRKIVGWVVACSFWAGCGSSSSSTAPAGDFPDAGGGPGPGVIEGGVAEVFEATVPPTLRISQGRKNPLVVSFIRGDTLAAVTITAEGLPPGVTAAPVTITDPNVTSATLILEADGTTVQGSTAPITVRTRVSTTLSLTSTVATRITGAPGSLDLTFGDKGRVKNYYPVVGGISSIYSRGVVTDASGRITVAYNLSFSSGDGSIGMMRFMPDGTPDATFNGGTALRIAPGASVNPSGLVQQADGKYLVYGWSKTGSAVAKHSLLVARIAADGSLDASYGSGTPFVGAATYDADASAADYSVAEALDGRLVKVGASEELVVTGLAGVAGAGQDTLVTQFDAAGALSMSFHGGSILRSPMSPNSIEQDTGRSIDIRADGRFLVADLRASQGNYAASLISYGPAGPIETGYPTQIIADSGPNTRAVWLPDGSILAIGANKAGEVLVSKHAYPTLMRAAGYGSIGSFGANQVVGILPSTAGAMLVAVTDTPVHGATFVRFDAQGAVDSSWGDAPAQGKATIATWETEGDLALQSAPDRTAIAATGNDRIIIATGRFLARIWN